MLRIIAVLLLGAALGTGAAVTAVATQSHSTNHTKADVVQYGNR